MAYTNQGRQASRLRRYLCQLVRDSEDLLTDVSGLEIDNAQAWEVFDYALRNLEGDIAICRSLVGKTVKAFIDDTPIEPVPPESPVNPFAAKKVEGPIAPKDDAAARKLKGG